MYVRRPGGEKRLSYSKAAPETPPTQLKVHARYWDRGFGEELAGFKQLVGVDM